MADYSTTPPLNAIQFLMPRRTGIAGAIDALGPLLHRKASKPTATHLGLQAIFDDLMNELWACDKAIMAMVPGDMADLAAQAEIVKYRYVDDLERRESQLAQLLDHIERLAA